MVLSKLTAGIRRYLFGPRPEDVTPGPSEELQEAAKDLRCQLDVYRDKPDPLAAMMIDIFNRREMIRKNNKH